jgi:hypothetical protein
MLRVLENYTRIGIEDSVLIANAYLPPNAAPNLLLASWLSLQPTSTIDSSINAAATSAVAENSTVAIDWTIEDFLKRNISLRFDQEPIEEAFRLIALEANDDLPAGVEPVEFVLDGDAFELAGITRNQQLRDFSIEQRPVREALTELAKQGNPVTTVTDTREADQKLIWVVKSHRGSPDRQQISLTTRETAAKQQLPLPPEFAADGSLD